MRRALAAILFLAVAACVPARAQDDEHWDARLTSATGAVTVYPVDGSEPAEGSEDMPLEEGDRIVTGEDSAAEIGLDGQSLISLGAGSDFTISHAAKADSEFTLALGSLLAKIQKLGSQRLRVRTPTAVAAVRGTEFGVDAGAGESHVGVFDEGRVEVEGQGATEVLTPNQETSVAKGRAPLKAFALMRFASRRAMMRGRIQKLQAMRQKWAKLAAGPRKRQRMKALQRKIKAVRQRKAKVVRRERKAQKNMRQQQRQQEREQRQRERQQRQRERQQRQQQQENQQRQQQGQRQNQRPRPKGGARAP